MGWSSVNPTLHVKNLLSFGHFQNQGGGQTHVKKNLVNFFLLKHDVKQF